jgi:hypothetical protein
MTAQKPRKPQRPRREPRGKTFKHQAPHPSRVGELIANAADYHWSQKIAEIFCPLDSRRDVVEPSEGVREALVRMAEIADDREAVAAIDGCGEETFGRLVAARYRREAIGEGVAQALRADARQALDDLDEQLKELRDLVKLDPTTDAVKASLKSMAKIQSKFKDAAEADEAALQARERCDWMTDAMLRRARLRRGGPADGGIAERLKADATDALKLLRKSRGGKPGDTVIAQAAMAVLRIWFAETGDLNPSIGHDPRRNPPTTPIVLRAIDLFERVDGKKRDASTVAKILRSARKPEKIR